MTPDRRIRFNGFKCSTVAHTTAGLWRHPDSQSHRYKELSFWIELAKTLERGKFDSLFVADALGVLDVYRGTPDQTLREGLQTPTDDPLLAVSAMAAATRHLGFGITVASLYELPYLFARKMTTLDHLTDGRIGWNIVTSALDSAARNLGRDDQIAHDERYAMTDEFMEVVYKLWEASWQDDAVVHDRASGIYADPAKVHAIGHHGRYYSVPGIFLCEPSRQRTPVLYQAGTSAAGRAFAGRHAEGVFISGQRPDIVRRLVDGVRAEAQSAGRDPRSVKFFAIMTAVTAPTDAEAQAKFQEYKSYASIEGNLARLSGITQVDIAKLDLDQPLEYSDTPGIRHSGELHQSGSNSALDAARDRRLHERVELRTGRRRRSDHGRRSARTMGRGSRHRRLQPGRRHAAGEFRRLRRARGAGAAATRPDVAEL